MRYENITEGRFLSRPNRFIALVEIEGQETVCHVKNTGRCRELLIPQAEVYLEKSSNPSRKTAYDLVGVKKGKKLVNMDSQAPNKVAHEWLKDQGFTYIRPESRFQSSRFDFYLEKGKRKAFMEVKGVTLETEGIARFPDAPTERGIKHIRELIEAKKQGYDAYLLFVIQMKEILQFEPNDETHPAFGQALREARAQGVEILAYDCVAEADSLVLDAPVAVKL